MVEVKGFPRPLYPPDSAPARAPSSDGPDVEAYKRCVSRAGRWPWQTFDQAFSNAFSHGKAGGNVADSGIAGVQRQGSISPTGFVGEGTFNLLRSIRIPDGLPHAGEMAMDATAAGLVDQAYERFHAAPAGLLQRRAFPSPNYSSRGGAVVRLLIVHSAEGARTIEELGSFFANPASGVSSHVGIDDKDGIIGEYVRRDWKAWTAANANPVGVQVELCAFAAWSRAEWQQHPNMLRNCARWLAEEAGHFDIPVVKLTAAQAQGSGRGVCQHRDLGSWGGGHTDAGDGFPIDDVVAMAKGFA
jgi:hypothetical protein